ncbi:E3 ubiquitin-protein ligase E3D-like isoform X2 [Ornithodoros turicata]|uniref:E3 ubiquitin-protein ligase E3D-like isoform X2 n=1 Tax=Ornithodoros turicata TaxID=34597 RepID=UPI003138DA32
MFGLPMKPNVSVSVELRPILNVCNVYITLEEIFADTTTVQVDADARSFTVGVRLNDAEVSTTQLTLPSEYRFRHETQSSIRKRVDKRDAETASSKRTELSFRIQVEGQCNMPHIPIVGTSEPGHGCTCMFRCRSCDSDVLAKETTFRRVLPLPSADWKEMAAEWFCHKHEDGGDVPSAVDPKADEMFTSVLCFNVHKSILANVGFNSVGELQCDNCHEVISKALDRNSMTVEVLRTRVDVWTLNGSTRLLLRRDATSVLSHMIKEQLSLSVSCRLILEAGDLALLVWVMETGLQYFKAVNLERGHHPICFQAVTKVGRCNSR